MIAKVNWIKKLRTATRNSVVRQSTAGLYHKLPVHYYYYYYYSHLPGSSDRFEMSPRHKRRPSYLLYAATATVTSLHRSRIVATTSPLREIFPLMGS